MRETTPEQIKAIVEKLGQVTNEFLAVHPTTEEEKAIAEYVLISTEVIQGALVKIIQLQIEGANLREQNSNLTQRLRAEGAYRPTNDTTIQF